MTADGTGASASAGAASRGAGANATSDADEDATVSPDDATDAPLLSVEGLTKHFAQADGLLDRLVGDAGRVRAVDGVDLTVRDGETVAVVGESGCGKSTLARTVLGLEDATAGTVRFRGDDVTGLSDRQLRPYRREVQMVFQDPLASLNPRKTVGEILAAPLSVHGIGDGPDDRRERVEELLRRVGLKPAHRDRYPHQFSGGQQQRVGVARALALSPSLLVADEPVSALDVSVQAQILDLLDSLRVEEDMSMLVITHDLSVVRQVADRVAVMYLGEIVETAPTDALFEDPKHPYTRALLSAVPRIDPERRTERVVLEGTVPSPVDPPSGCRFHTRCPEVIPPADWEADQSAFAAAFTFRTRVEAGELDPEAARTRLEAGGRDDGGRGSGGSAGSPDDAAVADYLVEQSLPCSPADLPDRAADAVREAAAAVARGDAERAAAIVGEAFPSPCSGEVPETVAVDGGTVAVDGGTVPENGDGGSRTVACHLATRNGGGE